MALTRADATILVDADISLAERRIQSLAKNSPRIRLNIDSSPLGRITGQVSEFQKSLTAASSRVLAFSLTASQLYVFSRAFQSILKSTIDVQKSLTDINTILQVSQRQLGQFSTGLFRVANETGQSFKTAAEAALEFSRQGLSLEQTLLRTKDALTLTRLSGLEVGKSVEAITAAINGFNDATLDSTKLVNKLATTDAAFAVSSKDLAEGLQRVGSTAKDTGVSFDSLIGLITSAQQTTARGGAVIGNALKSIFQRIQRSDTLEQLKELGVVTEQLNGETLAADRILINLAKRYDTLSSAQKNQVVQLSAGVFQANQFRAILQDLSRESSIYERATLTSTNATDQAAKRQSELNKTLSATINESLNNLTALASKVGSLTLEPVLRKLSGGFNEFVKEIGDTNDSPALGVGKLVGEGILKGLGNYLSGPGLILGAGLIIKLTGSFASFVGKSVAQVLEVSSAKYKQEQAIQQLIAQRPALEGEIVKINGSQLSVKEKQLQVERLLTRELLSQSVALGERVALINSISSLTASSTIGAILPSSKPLRRAGETLGLNANKTKAVGLVPAVQETLGALEGGYTPGQIKSTNIPSLGNVVYNDAEKVKYFPGLSQPAIIPPQSSKAGDNYNKSFINAHGFSPYAAGGIIPEMKWYEKYDIKRKAALKKYLESNQDYLKNIYPGANKALDDIIGNIPNKKKGFSPYQSQGLVPNYAQSITSAGTSLPQIPALFKKFGGQLGPKNIDIGGGKYELGTRFLQRKFGIKSRVYDPFNRSKEFNDETLNELFGKADTATIANVLNVIKEPGARRDLLAFIKDSIKKKGKAYFGIYQGNRSGIGAETSKGFQNNLIASRYDDEISNSFSNIQRRGNYIIASNAFSGFSPFANKGIIPNYANPFNIGKFPPRFGDSIKRASDKLQESGLYLKNSPINLEYGGSKGNVLGEAFGPAIYPPGGAKSQQPYIKLYSQSEGSERTLFHEYGHTIDQIIAKQNLSKYRLGSQDLLDIKNPSRKLLYYQGENAADVFASMVNYRHKDKGHDFKKMGLQGMNQKMTLQYEEFLEKYNSGGIGNVDDILARYSQYKFGGGLATPIPNFFPQISRADAAKFLMSQRQKISSITYNSESLGRPVEVNNLQWSSAVRHDLKTGTRPGNVKRQLQNEYLTLRGKFDGGDEMQRKNIDWDKIKQIRAQGQNFDVFNKGLVPNYASIFGMETVGKGSNISYFNKRDGKLVIDYLNSRKGTLNPFFELKRLLDTGGVKEIDFGGIIGPKVPHILRTVSERYKGSGIKMHGTFDDSLLDGDRLNQLNPEDRKKLTEAFSYFGLSPEKLKSSPLGMQKIERILSSGLVPNFMPQISNDVMNGGLVPNFAQFLYHGTLKSNIPSIKQNGLEPRVGSLVDTFYGNYEKEYGVPGPSPLTFLADKDNLHATYSAILHNLENKLKRRPTLKDIEEYGALAVVNPRKFYNREIKQYNERGDNPIQAEPGDYFTEDGAIPDRFITGQKLRKIYEQKLGYKLESSGLVPNFNALSSAISREHSAGLPLSQIRVGSSPRIQSNLNPLGLGVYNTRDEPGGLSQGISRVASMGFDPKRAGIPNYAKIDPRTFEFTSSATNIEGIQRQNLLQQQVQVEYIKQLRYVRLNAKSAEDAYKSFSDVAKTAGLLPVILRNVKSQFLGIERTAPIFDKTKTALQITSSGTPLFLNNLKQGNPISSQLGAALRRNSDYNNSLSQISRNLDLKDVASRSRLPFEIPISEELKSRLALAAYLKRGQGDIVETPSNVLDQHGRPSTSHITGINYTGRAFKTSPPSPFDVLNVPNLGTEFVNSSFSAKGTKGRRIGGLNNLLSKYGESIRSGLLDPASELAENIRSQLKDSARKIGLKGKSFRNFGKHLNQLTSASEEFAVSTGAVAEIARNKAKSAEISNFNQQYGNVGILNPFKFNRAIKEADRLKLGGKKQILEQRLQGQALVGSFAAPLIGGALEQGIGQFAGESLGGRGVARLAGGATSILGTGLTGLALSGGNPLGFLGGAALGVFSELPSIINTFTDKLPDLKRELEGLQETTQRTTTSLGGYINASEQYFEAVKKGGITIREANQLNRERIRTLTSVSSSEARNRIQKLVEKGDFTGARDVLEGVSQNLQFRKNLVETQAQYSGFKPGFFSYKTTGLSKEDKESFSRIEDLTSGIRGQETILRDLTPTSRGSKFEIQTKNKIQRLEQLREKEIKDFTQNSQFSTDIQQGFSQFLGLSDINGKRTSDVFAQQNILGGAKDFTGLAKNIRGLKGSGNFEEGFDPNIERFAKFLEDIQAKFKPDPTLLDTTFKNLSNTIEKLKEYERENQKIIGQSTEYGKALSNLSSQISNFTINAEKAANTFEIKISRQLSEFNTDVAVGGIRRETGLKIQEISAGDNKYFDSFLDLQSKLGQSRDDLTIGKQKVRGEASTQIANLLTSSLVDSQQNIEKELSSDPTYQKDATLIASKFKEKTNKLQGSLSQFATVENGQLTFDPSKINLDNIQKIQDTLQATEKDLEDFGQSTTGLGQILQGLRDNKKIKTVQDLYNTSPNQGGLVNAFDNLPRSVRDSVRGLNEEQLNQKYIDAIGNKKTIEESIRPLRIALGQVSLSSNQKFAQLSNNFKALGRTLPEQFIGNRNRFDAQFKFDRSVQVNKAQIGINVANEINRAQLKSQTGIFNLEQQKLITSPFRQSGLNRQIAIERLNEEQSRQRTGFEGGVFDRLTEQGLPAKSIEDIDKLIKSKEKRLEVAQRLGQEPITSKIKGELENLQKAQQDIADNVAKEANERENNLKIIDKTLEQERIREKLNSRFTSNRLQGLRQTNQNLAQEGQFGKLFSAQNIRDTVQTPLQTSQNDLFGQMSENLSSFSEDFRGAFKSGFAEAIKGSKDLGEALRESLLNAATNYLTRITGTALDATFGALFGTGQGGQSIFGGGESGFVGSLFKGFSSSSTQGYARGGYVTQGSGTKDDVPAFLSGGEFVLNQRATKKIGKENLDRINFGGSGGRFRQPRKYLKPTNADFSGAVTEDFVDLSSGTIRLANTFEVNKKGTKGNLNVSPLLSAFGQTDENNPQNRLKFAREQYLLQNRQLIRDYKKSVEKFESGQKQAYLIAFGSALVNAGAQYAGGKFQQSQFQKKAFQAGSQGNLVNSVNSAGYGSSVNQFQSVGGNPYIDNIRTVPLQAMGGYIPKFKDGGFYGGDQSGDRFSAMIQKGEYVISPQAVQKQGVNYFNNLNNAGNFQAGGYVGNTNTNDLGEAISKLIEINQQIRDTLDRANKITSPQGEKVDKNGKSGGTVINFSSTINITKEGTVKSEGTKGGKDDDKATQDDRESAIKLNKFIESKVSEYVSKEMKSGGALSEKFKSNR